ncbi:MAG TPA: RluA family pseudouridine synthase [Kiloniellales bacterium]|nr:RluA family pseudouridine synthase [Kiloniellales bacterium]
MADKDDGPRSFSVTVPEAAAGERADRFLAAALAEAAPGLSRSRLKALIEEGAVALGGRTLREPSARVKPGQVFAIFLPEPRPAEPEAQAIALTVVYEDADLIVVDKPAGLVVHPAPGNPDRTLVNALIAHCGASLSGVGGVGRPGIVHRLDKDTSGLLVAAKNDLAHQDLTRQFQARTIERLYQALVWGTPSPASGSISGAIGRDPRNRQRMAVVAKGGKEALTYYRVAKSMVAGQISLVECRLATGRTHQIRVHLAAKGHPLIGDPLYGRITKARLGALPTAARAAVQGFPRQALHAASLGFHHPRSKVWLFFQSAMPRDQESLMEELDAL